MWSEVLRYDSLTMKVIDARTGREVLVNQTINYGDGESTTLLAVLPGILQARAKMRMTYRDYSLAGAPLVTTEFVGPLVVRWMHPCFLGKHVAFIPS